MNSNLLEVSTWFPDTPDRVKRKYAKVAASPDMSNFGCAGFWLSIASVVYAIAYGNKISWSVAGGLVVITFTESRIRSARVRRISAKAEKFRITPCDLTAVFERGSRAAMRWQTRHGNTASAQEIAVIEERMAELARLYYAAARLEKSGAGQAELSLTEPKVDSEEWYQIARQMAQIVARLELFVEG
jgi:hypothetical protein